MFERLNTSIPVFSLSKSSYNLLRRYINEDGLSITMHGNNNIESKVIFIKQGDTLWDYFSFPIS